MATTRTLAGGVRISIRGTPDPNEQYGYAAVFHLSGPFPFLLRRSTEAAIKDVLSTHRTASWTWLDEYTLSLRLTRNDPERAAEVATEVLSAVAERFEADLERADDEAFDRALAEHEG